MILFKASTEEGTYYIFHPTLEMDSIMERDESGESRFNENVSSDGGVSIDNSKLARLGFDFLGLLDLFDAGFDLVLSEDEDEVEVGIAMLEAGVADYRFLPKAWLGLGFAYKMKKDFYRAIDSLENVFSVPDDVYENEEHKKNILIAAYRDLVYCCGKLGDDDRALKYARDGYDVAPDDLAIVANLASACLMTGNLREARKYFEEAEKIDPEDRQVQEALLEVEMKLLEEQADSE